MFLEYRLLKWKPEGSLNTVYTWTSEFSQCFDILLWCQYSTATLIKSLSEHFEYKAELLPLSKNDDNYK